MEQIHELMSNAIDRLNNKVQPVFNPAKWELTGEVLEYIDCYDRTEVVNSICGNWSAIGTVSSGELVRVEEIEFI